MTEFTINGNAYRARKLNAFQQMHVSRKLAGVLPKLLPAVLAVGGLAALEESNPEDLEKLFVAIAPAGEALAAMPEADADLVYHTCLSVVQRKQGEAYTAVWNESAKRFQFEDMDDVMVITQVVIHVIKDSLGNFMRGFTGSLAAQNP